MSADYSVKEALIRSGVASGGVTYSFFGLPFSDLAAILTSIFMLISIILTFPKIYAMIKQILSRNRQKEEEEVLPD